MILWRRRFDRYIPVARSDIVAPHVHLLSSQVFCHQTLSCFWSSELSLTIACKAYRTGKAVEFGTVLVRTAINTQTFSYSSPVRPTTNQEYVYDLDNVIEPEEHQ